MTKNPSADSSDTPEAKSLDGLIAEASNAIDTARAEAESALAASAGTDLELRVDNAIDTKRRLASGYGAITHAAAAAQSAAKAAELEAKRMIDDAQAMLRAKLAELQPMLDHAKRLEDGIAAVNLYLGRDEYIETLRDGEPAAAGSALTIRQQVLAMDEESALNAATGGNDFKGIEEFVSWILAEPANLDQVIPDQLGVVSVMPRREMKDYGNTFENMAKNALNRQSWWLIRNGERLYLHTTEFSVGQRLVPTRDEFTKMFEYRDFGGELVPLEPGTQRWLDAEKAADAKTRHYMKIALILQGLVDRTTVFRPLPVEGLSLLTQEHYETGHVQIVSDDELALTEGRPSFHDWQKSLNDDLDRGMRVIGFFNGYGEDERERVSPRNASRPSSLVAHTISRADGSSLWFTYDRTDDVMSRDRWGRTTWGPAKTRATYRLDRRTWATVRWLPVDTIDLDDLRFYLSSRTERHAYVDMFPVIQAVIAFREQEAREEAPFRALISGALDARDLTIGTDADAYAEELIRWWKTKNKIHRALNGAGDHERKAQDGILTEAARRATGTDTDQEIAASILALHPDALVVARRTNDFIAVVPEARQYTAAADDVFVTVHEFTGKGRPRLTKTWQVLSHAQTARWTVLHTAAGDRWSLWRIGVPRKLFFTDEQIDTAVESIRERFVADGLTPFAIAMQDGDPDTMRSPKFRVATGSSYRSKRPWGSDRDEVTDDLVQGRTQFTVTFDSEGAAVLPERFHTNADEWRPRHGGFRGPVDPGADSPHLTNWSGSVDPSGQVWFDEAVYAGELELGAEWFRAYQERRTLADAGQHIYMQLCSDWERRNEERVFARFMDDFGDASLWEGHRKALRNLGYPYRTTARPASAFDDALRAVGRAAAAEEELPVGVPVRELMDRYTIATAAVLPEDVLELTIPEPSAP